MTDTKIPMRIFTSYEALTEYYGERPDMELGLYVSDEKLLVGHAPTAYSFNPQYFTDENELMPDYVPESPIDYTITATSNNTTYGYVTGGGTYPQHSEITLNAYAYNGYKFDKWSNGVETSAYTFAVEEDANLVGNFADNTYTVTLNINIQDSGTMTGAGTYISGTSVTVTATPNEGFIFDGWTPQGSPYIISSNPEYTFILEEDTALMANFGQIYTVSATPNNVSYGSTSGSGTYNSGSSATVTATPNENYRFVNWTKNGVEVSTDTEYTFTVYDDTALVANFEAATANINISANPAGYGSVDAAGSTIIGESYTVMAEANTGYVFVNWTEDGTEVSTSANYTFTVTGDRTLVANFMDPATEPFYVENVTDSDITLSITKNNAGAPTVNVEYSTDGENWSSLGSTSTTSIRRTIAPGTKLYLRARTNNWGSIYVSNEYYNYILSNGNFAVGGNITSLQYGSEFVGQRTLKYSEYTFAHLLGDTYLVDASKLILPTNTMQGCYYSMFSASNITSITLPAAYTNKEAYYYMFKNCRQLTYIKCLATSPSSDATYQWVMNVSATGTFVKAAGATWATNISGIPSGWTVVEEPVS